MIMIMIITLLSLIEVRAYQVSNDYTKELYVIKLILKLLSQLLLLFVLLLQLQFLLLQLLQL